MDCLYTAQGDYVCKTNKGAVTSEVKYGEMMPSQQMFKEKFDMGRFNARAGLATECVTRWRDCPPIIPDPNKVID